MGFFVVACIDGVWVSFAVAHGLRAARRRSSLTLIMVDGQLAAAGALLRLRVRLPGPREDHRAHRPAGARRRRRATARRASDDRDRAAGAAARRHRAAGRHRGERDRAEGQGDRDRARRRAARPAGRRTWRQGAQLDGAGSRIGAAAAQQPRLRRRWPPTRVDELAAAADLAGVEGAAPVPRRLHRGARRRCPTSTTSSRSTPATWARRRSRPGPRGARAGGEVLQHLPARRAQRARRAHRLQRAQPVPPARRGAARDAAHGRTRCARDRGALQVLRRSSRTAWSLGFVTETVAYDLARCASSPSRAGAPAHDALLRVFLEIDKEAESQAQENTLRGVRKAQVKLASYYLLRGAERRTRAASSTTCATSGRAAALDPRRAAGDRVEGLLGGHRPRHQLRLPDAERKAKLERVLLWFDGLARRERVRDPSFGRFEPKCPASQPTISRKLRSPARDANRMTTHGPRWLRSRTTPTTPRRAGRSDTHAMVRTA